MNHGNDRCFSHGRGDVHTEGFSAKDLVSSVVSEADVMVSYFSQKGERITEEVYLDVLQTVSEGRPYVPQYDSALTHTSRLVEGRLL